MKGNLQRELAKNRFFIVKNGLFIVVFIIGLILISLYLLKIDNQSILLMVYKYYFR